MHSKETLKILRLLSSEDIENQKLAQLLLTNMLTKENVMFWYIALELYATEDTGLSNKMTDLLEWHPSTKPVEKYVDIVNFMRVNKSDAKSINKFIEHYNNYLYHTISSTWDTERRIEIQSQITSINGHRLSE